MMSLNLTEQKKVTLVQKLRLHRHNNFYCFHLKMFGFFKIVLTNILFILNVILKDKIEALSACEVEMNNLKRICACVHTSCRAIWP